VKTPTVVDRLEVLVLVDNVTDNLSSNPVGVTTEWTFLRSSGRMQLMCGKAFCCAHHGLSLLLTAHVGSLRHSILFDAGPEAAGFLRNAEVLSADLSTVKAVVLSHGHWDHAGGLLAAIQAINGGRQNKVECFMHPDMFAQRGVRLADGSVGEFEPVPGVDTLKEAGAAVQITREPALIAEGAFFVSGEIPRVTPYETGMPGQVRKPEPDGNWVPDELLQDERFVAVNVKGKGLMIFTACSHAGVINVLRHAKETFPAVPLYGVMGGLHLSGATEKIIPQTVADLGSFNLKLIAAGHCTGWRALNALATAMGDALVPSAVGKRYVI
jgi:7,8-dihydropterin-6-yl-methyl-4-(beta-D-ribofuranosyl)aminobenzene 5'-phosphate synthase